MNSSNRALLRDVLRSAGQVAAVAIPAVLAGCSQPSLIGVSPPDAMFQAANEPAQDASRTTARDVAARAPALNPGVGAAGLVSNPAKARVQSAANTALVAAGELRRSGDKRGALAGLDKAAVGNEFNAEIAAQRGMLALELGQLATAERLLRQAVHSDGSDWRWRSALGSAYSAQGKQEQARHELSLALKQSPENPAILNNLALCHALEGNSQAAGRLLRRVIAKAPGSSAAQQARLNLVLILGAGGDVEGAKKAARARGASKGADLALLEAVLSSPSAGGAPKAGASSVATAANAASSPVYRLGGPQR